VKQKTLRVENRTSGYSWAAAAPRLWRSALALREPAMTPIRGS